MCESICFHRLQHFATSSPGGGGKSESFAWESSKQFKTFRCKLKRGTWLKSLKALQVSSLPWNAITPLQPPSRALHHRTIKIYRRPFQFESETVNKAKDAPLLSDISQSIPFHSRNPIMRSSNCILLLQCWGKGSQGGNSNREKKELFRVIYKYEQSLHQHVEGGWRMGSLQQDS